MEDSQIANVPPVVAAILRDTEALGFRMASEAQTGALLCCLATSKPGGRLLELGTGTGVGTAWLLAGMDTEARLETVDNDEACIAVARRHLARDQRVTFHVADGGEFLRKREGQPYDLIFADTWPGKFHDLEAALSLLAPGGLYVIDDLLPQPSWPEEHGQKIPPLIAALEAHRGLSCTKLAWATGIMIAAKTALQTNDHDSHCLDVVPELPVSDLARARKWFRDMLGFRTAWVWEDKFAAVCHGEVQLYLRRMDSPAPGVRCYLHVKDADLLYDRCKQQGARIVDDLESKPWGAREFAVEVTGGHILRIGHGEKRVDEISQFTAAQNSTPSAAQEEQSKGVKSRPDSFDS